MKTRHIKMKMLAKVLRTISSILFWVFAVLLAVFVVASIVILFIPGEKLILPATVAGNITASFNGVLTFNVGPQDGGEIALKPFLEAMFNWAVWVALMMAIGLFEMKRILKSVIEDNPFEKGNSKNLTVIAVTLIAGSFVIGELEGRIFAAVIQALHIGHIEVGYSVNWTLLVTGILILILAGVFSYGSYLQEEVDSTL